MNVTLYGKRDCSDVIKNLEMGDYLGLSGWAQYNDGSLLYGARGSESEDKVIGDKRMEACTLNMEEAATRS